VNGANGTSGTSGNSGTSGSSGTSGTSGATGGSGTSGSSGTSGTSGATGGSGTSGTSGTSPSGGITGSLTPTFIPYASSGSSLADSYLYNDTGNTKLYTDFSGQVTGLNINYAGSDYYIGDYAGANNNNHIQINDGTQQMTFQTNELIFSGGLTNTSSWTASSRFWEVTINGVAYNIQLYV
jgi:hypothetical protein